MFTQKLGRNSTKVGKNWVKSAKNQSKFTQKNWNLDENRSKLLKKCLSLNHRKLFIKTSKTCKK